MSAEAEREAWSGCAVPGAEVVVVAGRDDCSCAERNAAANDVDAGRLIGPCRPIA